MLIEREVTSQMYMLLAQVFNDILNTKLKVLFGIYLVLTNRVYYLALCKTVDVYARCVCVTWHVFVLDSLQEL